MKQAQIITIAEIRGGTGKTTTAQTLAQAAKMQGKKVLVIDLDGQGTITNKFGADISAPGVWALLQLKTPVYEVIQKTKQGVDIIAGAPDLYAIKLEKGGLFALEQAIEPITKSYDLILIDTAPALNDLTFNAMQASNNLLIALTADDSAADGLLYLLDYAKEIKRTNKKLKVLGCIVTQYDNRPNINKQMRQLVEDVATAKKCPYLGEIRKSAAIFEAGAYGKNLFEYAPKSKPAEDYKRLYDKIIK